MGSGNTRYAIAIVGAGRVGQTLGRLLTAVGHRITTVSCRTRAAAEQAVAFIGGGQPCAYHNTWSNDAPYRLSMAQSTAA